MNYANQNDPTENPQFSRFWGNRSPFFRYSGKPDNRIQVRPEDALRGIRAAYDFCVESGQFQGSGTAIKRKAPR